uniref:Uncharacterized protein n=1 Tax=Amphiprion ocellaris TaxID=80972 RepID=A0AAQ5YCL5_AMPOC
MSILAVLLRAGSTFCQSAGNLLLPVRAISTSTCCRIRMHAIPQLKTVDRWTEKRSMFGVYDNVGILGQLLLDVDSQKAEVTDPFYTGTTNENGLKVHFVITEVYDELLCFGCVQEQVIVPTPHSQLLHLIPVSRLITSCDAADHCGIVHILDEGVTGVDGGAV